MISSRILGRVYEIWQQLVTPAIITDMYIANTGDLIAMQLYNVYIYILTRLHATDNACSRDYKGLHCGVDM